jgi:hypothetical protein
MSNQLGEENKILFYGFWLHYVLWKVLIEFRGFPYNHEFSISCRKRGEIFCLLVKRVGEKLLLLLKSKSISENLHLQVSILSLPPSYTCFREKEREHMRILHLSKPRCKALQGFFWACV